LFFPPITEADTLLLKLTGTVVNAPSSLPHTDRLHTLTIMSPPKPMEGNEEEIKKKKAIVESTDK